MRFAPLEPWGNEFKHCHRRSRRSISEVRHVGLTGTWGLFDKAAACGLDHGFSQPCATFTLKRAHVMSCLIHDSRLTSAIDLGHTLPPCLKPMLKPY